MYDPGLAKHLRARSSHYPSIRIREFLVAYLMGIAGWAVSVVLSFGTGFPFSLITYPVIGFLLSRFATRKFEQGQLHWNWHRASIDSLARTKLAMLLGWPISFLRLIWLLAIYKFL